MSTEELELDLDELNLEELDFDGLDSTEFEAQEMTVTFDGSSYKDTNALVPEGALGWRSLLDQVEAKLGEADYLRLHPQDPYRADAVYGYRRADETPHWLLVAFATSELYEKNSDDTDRSGWGFELTIRFASDADEPPQEALEFINAIVEYVREYRAPLGANHTLDLSAFFEDTSLEEHGYVALREDPELASIDTVNGKVQFLQIITTTQAEQNAMFDWNNEKMLELLEKHVGQQMISDLGRPCWLADPNNVAFIEERINTEGSSGELLFACEQIEAEFHPNGATTLSISSDLVPSLIRRLRGRTLFERPLQILSEEFELTVNAAEQSSFDAERVVLELSESASTQLIERLESQTTEFACPEVSELKFVLDV